MEQRRGGENYAYVILPGKTQEQMRQYVQNPAVQIVCNTEKVQAVRQMELGIDGYVFWESGSCNGIGVSSPLIIMTKSYGNVLELAFSDPTQKLEYTEITLDGEYRMQGAPEGITWEIIEGKTVIRSNFIGSKGKSTEIKLEAVEE